MTSRRITLGPSLKASLQQHGVAVQYFPRYVNRTLRPHSLNALLLSFVVRGRGRHVIGKTEFEESGGSIAITHYGEVHDILTDAGGMDIYNILLDPATSVLPSLPPDLRETLHVILPQHKGFRNQMNRAIHLEIPEPARLAEITARMAEEINRPAPGSADVVAACLRIFLIECCRAAQRSGIQSSHALGTPAWVERLCARMDTQYAQQLTLEDLAVAVRLSPGYLCRAFKRHTGKTVFAYLIERRIQAAMLRLSTTDDKVIAIALECGFNDLTYFNRKFRQLLGCTPTANRRRQHDPALVLPPTNPICHILGGEDRHPHVTEHLDMTPFA